MDYNYRFQSGPLKGCICRCLTPNGNPHSLELMTIAQYSKLLISFNEWWCKENKYI